MHKKMLISTFIAITRELTIGLFIAISRCKHFHFISTSPSPIIKFSGQSKTTKLQVFKLEYLLNGKSFFKNLKSFDIHHQAPPSLKIRLLPLYPLFYLLVFKRKKNSLIIFYLQINHYYMLITS